MKANGAPEKLYIDSREHWMKSWTAFTTKAKSDDIEYTRTDAFIEKACDAYCKVCKMPNCRRNECKMIEDFKKYMSEKRRREAHDQE